MERSTSVFSPVLWLNVVKALPGELRAASGMFGSWIDHMRTRLDIVRIGTLIAAVLLFIVVAIPGNRYLRRFEGRPVLPETVGKDGKPTAALPTRLKRALAALRVTLMWAIVPIIVCTGLFNLLDALDLINDRVENIVRTLLFGIAFVAFAHGLADGLLAPD